MTPTPKDGERMCECGHPVAAEAKLREAREALGLAVDVANIARVEWDEAPQGMKAGKLLIALSGHLPGYRPDTDKIHSTLRALSNPE